MKILLSTDTISQERGGIEGHCYRLARAFSTEHSVTVLCNASKSDIPYGVACIDGRRHEGNPYSNLLSSIRAVRGIREKTFDVIICSSWRTSMVAWYLRKRVGIPYYIQVHGNDLLEPRASIPKGLVEKLIRSAMLKGARGIVANSEFTENLCHDVTSNESVVVIHPSISYRQAASAPQKPGRLNLFSLGRLEERKGIQLVLKALKKLQEQGHAEITYRIGGVGPFEDSLKRLSVELGLIDVAFLGRISEEVKAQEYSACDAFVMPSYYEERQGSVEGFGIVFVEANMYGKPVIAARSGGVSDAVIDGVTGILVPERDIDALADAIRTFAEGSFTTDPAVLKEWAAQHTAKAIAERYIQLFNEDLGIR